MSVNMLIGLNLNYVYFKYITFLLGLSLQTNTIYPNNTLKEEKINMYKNNNNSNICLQIIYIKYTKQIIALIKFKHLYTYIAKYLMYL